MKAVQESKNTRFLVEIQEGTNHALPLQTPQEIYYNQPPEYSLYFSLTLGYFC